MDPLMRMPRLLAPPSPAKKLSGTLMTTAQGQLMTRNVQARRSQSRQTPAMFVPVTSSTRGGSTARARAP